MSGRRGVAPGRRGSPADDAVVARNETRIEARPATAWRVLADPMAYGQWVAGAKETRFADAGWPAPGSTLHHTQGRGPLVWKDSASVLAAEPPRRLVLEVRVRPWAINRVELRLTAEGAATRVVMEERPTGGLVDRVPGPLVDALLRARNAEALRGLRRLVERG